MCAAPLIYYAHITSRGNKQRQLVCRVEDHHAQIHMYGSNEFLHQHRLWSHSVCRSVLSVPRSHLASHGGAQRHAKTRCGI
jgi:hypothetical protein